jgi:hypothetical protein
MRDGVEICRPAEYLDAGRTKRKRYRRVQQKECDTDTEDVMSRHGENERRHTGAPLASHGLSIVRRAKVSFVVAGQSFALVFCHISVNIRRHLALVSSDNVFKTHRHGLDYDNTIRSSRPRSIAHHQSMGLFVIWGYPEYTSSTQ